MSLGSLLLNARTRYGHGLVTAYYRDVVRPRIVNSDPVEGTTDPGCEIHVLTSEGDALNLLWALKSFYRVAPRRFALCIHDDGSLSDRTCGWIARLFPAARLIRSTDAEPVVMASLESYPLCRELRRTNLLAQKLFDFRTYLASDRMLLLDSDVLFFTEPTALLSRIANPDERRNTANADVSTAYTLPSDDLRRVSGVPLVERFNSGLGLIHRGSLRLEWLEEFLAIPGIVGHFWRIEQTLFALCSSRFGCDLLPLEYDVQLNRQANHGPVRHYVGAIRHLMYRDGIRRLVRQGLLRHGEET